MGAEGAGEPGLKPLQGQGHSTAPIEENGVGGHNSPLQGQGHIMAPIEESGVGGHDSPLQGRGHLMAPVENNGVGEHGSPRAGDGGNDQEHPTAPEENEEGGHGMPSAGGAVRGDRWWQLADSQVLLDADLQAAAAGGFPHGTWVSCATSFRCGHVTVHGEHTYTAAEDAEVGGAMSDA